MDEFFAPRRCLREPIPEIYEVANILSLAADAHLAGNRSLAEILIRKADQPKVYQWTDSLWGSRVKYPEQPAYHRHRLVAGAPPHLPKNERIRERMPSRSEKRRLLLRYGHHCAFCGIPVIRPEVRDAFRMAYPEAARWGSSDAGKHAGFICLWLQYDHLLPHSRGGDNSLENLAITCTGCNYGRMHWTLEELGLIDPRTVQQYKSEWDGLENMLKLPSK